jgi:CHAT domain-containing protein/lipopolysaccharide biosynthesis regulator YciM
MIELMTRFSYTNLLLWENSYRSLARLLLVVSLLVLPACSGPSGETEQRAEGATELAVNNLQLSPDAGPTEYQLAPGQTHTHYLQAEAGQYLHLVVDQRGVDVVASLLDAQDQQLVRVDRPLGEVGPETLIAVTESAGEYRIVITAPEGDRPSGAYSVVVEELRLATTKDRSVAAAARAFYEGDELRRQGKSEQAIERLSKAHDLWQKLAEPTWQAESLQRLGRVHGMNGRWQQAADLYKRAADLFHAAESGRWEGITLHFLGLSLYQLGRTDEAIPVFQRALQLRHESGYKLGECTTAYTLAQVYQLRDEVQPALDLYNRAYQLLEESPGHEMRRNSIIHDLGALYLSLGMHDRALERFQTAAAAWSQLGDRRRQASSMSQLGKLYQQQGDLQAALEYHQQALELRQQVEHRTGIASSLSKLGQVYQALGELDQALAHHRQALATVRELGQPWSEATVMLNLGLLHEEMDQTAVAEEIYRQALTLNEQVGDQLGVAESLLGIARAARSRGELEKARKTCTQAIEIFESVRHSPVSHELRTSFFAGVQSHFGLLIDILMELHQRHPQADYEAAALSVAERARARSLLDLLHEAGAQIRHDADPDLLEREKELQNKLNRAELKRLKLRDRPMQSPEKLAESDRQVQAVIAELDMLRGEILTRSPRYAALTRPAPLSLQEIRRLVDNNTLLMQYWLGEEQGFVWTVTPTTVASFELPGRDLIEGAAREAYDLLTRSYRHETRYALKIALEKLSKQLLAPVAGQLSGKRLLIVSHGALQLIPFAALPDPNANPASADRPLIQEHEITYLPSASTLAALRRESRGPTALRGRIAVVADPVFAAADERLDQVADPADRPEPHLEELDRSVKLAALVRSGTDPNGYSFSRLPNSQREAQAILSLVPVIQSYQASGFAATKEMVVEGRLSGYQIVHFATHGVLNTEHPQLSGVVLSLVDEQGRPRDGFLREHEIYNLELPCDLVVLSACETALGKEIRGEGLAGLARSFMYAGAARVMVSLWKISDLGTAELMEELYDGLLEQGLRPGAALRAAQIATMQKPGREAPYFWAGFVIQGEWQ